MIAALATIVFLSTLWLTTLIAAEMLGRSFARVGAALRGQVQPDRAPAIWAGRRMQIVRRPLRATSRLRAAA